MSQAKEVRIHDKRLLDETAIVNGIPDEIPIQVDLGFLGLQHEDVNVEMPHKSRIE